MSRSRRGQVRTAVALLETSEAIDEAIDEPSNGARIDTEAGFRRLLLLAKGGLLPKGNGQCAQRLTAKRRE